LVFLCQHLSSFSGEKFIVLLRVVDLLDVAASADVVVVVYVRVDGG